MSDSLTDLILSLTPEDGSTIGNGAMMALLREQVPGLTDDDDGAARAALVDEGVLARGKGRGGSIFRPVGEDPDADDDGADNSEDEFELTAPEEGTPQPRRAKAAKAAPRKSGEPVQVVSYRHGDRRVNNPEVGMVHAGTDPDGAKTVWAYGLHLDPVLNFDSARSGVERLIDDALASGDAPEDAGCAAGTETDAGPLPELDGQGGTHVVSGGYRQLACP